MIILYLLCSYTSKSNVVIYSRCFIGLSLYVLYSIHFFYNNGLLYCYLVLLDIEVILLISLKVEKKIALGFSLSKNFECGIVRVFYLESFFFYFRLYLQMNKNCFNFFNLLLVAVGTKIKNATVVFHEIE